MTNLTKITETDTEYIVKGNLKLIKDFKTNKNLIVKGNILGDDKERYNLRARDIGARDIICEERIKKYKDVKTMARIFIENKSKLERKEQK